MTTKRQLSGILPIVLPDFIKMIAETYDWSFLEATGEFYKSKLGKEMEKEGCNLWALSKEKLLDMYIEERETGVLDLPTLVFYNDSL